MYNRKWDQFSIFWSWLWNWIKTYKYFNQASCSKQNSNTTSGPKHHIRIFFIFIFGMSNCFPDSKVMIRIGRMPHNSQIFSRLFMPLPTYKYSKIQLGLNFEHSNNPNSVSVLQWGLVSVCLVMVENEEEANVCYLSMVPDWQFYRVAIFSHDWWKFRWILKWISNSLTKFPEFWWSFFVLEV